MSGINELEKKAEAAHLHYRKQLRAVIMKVPVPFLITPKGMIPQKSTVDYTGVIAGGKFIAFDAKETLSKTSFPMANIHQHQYIYLKYTQQLGGISFFMIHFKTVFPDQVFIVPLKLIDKYMDLTAPAKSIKLAEFSTHWLTNIDSYLDHVIETQDELKEQ